MVLQDKYKARASARYRAAHGMAPKERGRGRGRGRGGMPRSGPGRGEGTSQLSGEEDEEGEGEEGEENEAEGEFPTLQAAAQQASKSEEQKAQEAQEAEEARAEARRYARRPIQSNAWRFEQLQADLAPKDPRLAEEEGEEEEEEDLTELLEKVKQLDTSKGAVSDGVFARPTQEAQPALDPEEKERRRRQAEEDIDHELDYLKARAQARAQAKGKRPPRPDAAARTPPKALSKEEMEKELALLAEIEEKRQHAEHLRSLKARFTGRSLGERATQGRTLDLSPARTGGAVTGGTVHGGIDKRSIGSGKGAPPPKPTAPPAKEGPIKIEDAEDFLDSIL